MNNRLLLPALAAMLAIAPKMLPSSPDPGWRIIAGSGLVEQTAAKELAASLPAASVPVIIGSPATHPLISAEHKARPFTLTEDPESFNAAGRNGRLWIVGASPKGAMNGVFRLLDSRPDDLAQVDICGAPAFRLRVGGNLMNQHPPPGWSEDDQARYYARHYINVVWGEKHDPPIGYEARKKYGLGLMIEFRFPSAATEAWWNDPANRDAIYHRKAGEDRRVISPFSEAGRRWYLDGYRKLLAANPGTRILYGVFGDYNTVPGNEAVRVADGKPFGHTREESIKEILGIMKEAVGHRDILIAAWLWHAFYGNEKGEQDFMKELAALGYGPMYNEAGNSDCWILKRDNYTATAVAAGPEGKTPYGEGYLPLISSGGACESINPVIGFPSPRVAQLRIARLAEIGAQNFCTWWAGYEGWVYQPNNEVVAEMIWTSVGAGVRRPSGAPDPFDPKNGDPLLRKIARRDFGPGLAPGVLEFWKLFDDAVITAAPLYQSPAKMPPPEESGLHPFDWFQRMGVFTEDTSFGGPVHVPLIPQALASRKDVTKPKEWMLSEHVRVNYETVVRNLDRAIVHLETLQSGDAQIAKRLRDMRLWTVLYRRLLETQHHYHQAVAVMVRQAGEPDDSPALRSELTPILEAEIANGEALIGLIPEFPPNFNIRSNMEQTIANTGSGEDETRRIQKKIAAMKQWMRP